MYGTQASVGLYLTANMFENDVKMYGTQAAPSLIFFFTAFENDVKMYGTQAYQKTGVRPLRLRMM